MNPKFSLQKYTYSQNCKKEEEERAPKPKKIS